MLWFPPRWLKIRRPFLAVVLQGIFDVVLTPSHPFQKHSARSVLHAISGSKSILSWCSSAIRIRELRVGVRDMLSRWEIPTRGFRIGAIPVIRVSSSVAHSCGFLHPFDRSFAQSIHVQVGFGVCWLYLLVRILADVCIRSVTVFTRCLFRRQLVGVPVMGRGVVLMWNQAGSWALMFGAILSAARFVLYFLAVFIILIISLFRNEVLGPLVGGCQLC